MRRPRTHQEGLTSDQARYLNGPDYERDEIAFCPTCEVEKEMTVTGHRSDKYDSAHCGDCDTQFAIEKEQPDGEFDDYCW
jgi:transcription elongation factor Elf1